MTTELSPEPRPRPKWAEAIRHFVCDGFMDDEYDFPEDGSDDALSDEIENAVNAILCRAYGHEIIDDQCGRPEHRYCVYCRRRVDELSQQQQPGESRSDWKNRTFGLHYGASPGEIEQRLNQERP